MFMSTIIAQQQTLTVAWERDGYRISIDRSLLDIDFIHNYLANESYWASGIPREVVEKSIRHSLCFGLYFQEQQVGFARVVTDYATFAYLGDVFIVEAHRGQALGKWLIKCIVDHSELQHLRRWMLATADAHSLYEQYGFTPISQPQRFMERHNPEVYKPLITIH